jgi:hypothetical protein
MQYDIIEASSPEKLVELVNAKRSEGYEPHGGVAVVHNPESLTFGKYTFYQAVVCRFGEAG